ncbi:MAG: hypothetical protein ACM3NV_07685 [Syntrophothermus sp.]
MTGKARPRDEELLAALRGAFAAAGLDEPERVRRRRSEYWTSFPLERLTVRDRSGQETRLAFKRVEWEAMHADARLAKPRFLHDPRREAAVYASVLPAAPAGPPRYLGSTDAGRDGTWLFVEWIDGRSLVEHEYGGPWLDAARWLGALHVATSADLDRHAERGRLMRADGFGYLRWLERARRFAAARDRRHPSLSFLGWLAGRYGAVVEELGALPLTVVHGDFYPANVLVANGAGAPRVAPVDWESAAVAPGLLDLAALVSGGWTERERAELAAAYASVPGVPRFEPRKLDLARLHVAVQWLGWAPPPWSPPQGQRHDWLADATAIAEGLDL